METNDLNQKIELRIRTIRTLWFGLMTSVGMYFVLTIFVARPVNAKPNNVLSLVFVGIGMLTTLASVLIKQKLLSRSVEQQDVAMVQQAYILAWALCEVSALFGLVDYFVTGNRFYYVPFLIALIGDLINFPRRQDVEAAAYKKFI